MNTKLTTTNWLTFLFPMLGTVLVASLLLFNIPAEKKRLGDEDISLLLTSGSTSGLSQPELFEKGYYIVKLAANQQAELSISSKRSRRIRIVSGLLPWKDQPGANVGFDAFIEDDIIAEGSLVGADIEFKDRVDAGDSLVIKLHELAGRDTELCFTLEEDRLSWIYSFMLLLPACWFLMLCLRDLVRPVQRILPLLFILGAIWLETITPVPTERIWSYFTPIVLVFLWLILVHFSRRLKSPFSFLLVAMGNVAILSFSLLIFVQIVYFISFHHPLSDDQWLAIFQSNAQEGLEFFAQFGNWKLILGFLLILLLWFVLFSRYEKRQSSLFPNKWVVLILVLLSVPVVGTGLLRSASFGSFVANYSFYREELNAFKDKRKEYDKVNSKLEAKKKGENESYLIIIGESLNKDHMSVYGYFRKTTPVLDSLTQGKGVSVFRNVWSNHTHTMPVIKQSFTQANQYNELTASEAVQLIPILKKAGFKTHWLSNQTRYGAWDNVVTVIAESCEEVYFLNKSIGKKVETKNYDEDLIPVLENWLKKRTGNEIYFVHLMGNHGDYVDRYPTEFEVFTEDTVKGETGNMSNRSLHKYDNSVLYNDYVVSRLVRSFNYYTSQDPAAWLYFSDHGEDVIHWKGHNSGAMSPSMTRIPFIVGLNEKYQSNYPESRARIDSVKRVYFTNDLLDNIILGLTQVESEHRVLKYDPLSEEYSLKPDDLLLMHGKNKLSESQNDLFWKEANQQKIKTRGWSTKISAHRVNSKAMLYETVARGIESIELDVMIRVDSLGSAIFEIGHGEGAVMSGNTLEEVLSWEKLGAIKKLWFDFKNLNDQNQRATLHRLDELNSIYGFKHKALIETTSRASWMNEFEREGYYMSYYLPNDWIGSEETTILKRRGNDVASWLNRNRVTAISFDSALYPFVRDYVTPQLNRNLDLHTWDLNLNYSQPDLLNNYEQLPFSSDTAVKTILIRFDSDFYL